MTVKTTTKTFSIDNKLYERFELICETKHMNKSKVIQDAIRKFISENYDIDINLFYRLKMNIDSELVQIEKKEEDFILLNNGNRLNIFDFETLYELQDPGVNKVLQDLIGETSILSNAKVLNTDDEIIDPSILENHIVSKEQADRIKKTFMNVDILKIRDENETIIRDVETNEKVINKSIEEQIEQLKEKYSITDKIEIVKKIKEKRPELIEFSNKELKQFDLNKLENILSYIYDTDIKIDESFLGNKPHYIINIPLKYVDINFKNLMNYIEGFDYVTNDIQIKSMSEKINENIKNMGVVNFEIHYQKFSQNCSLHITEQLKRILNNIIQVDEKIVVHFDNPLYIITIPGRFICEEVKNFIVNSYSIKRDYVIFKNNI